MIDILIIASIFSFISFLSFISECNKRKIQKSFIQIKRYINKKNRFKRNKQYHIYNLKNNIDESEEKPSFDCIRIGKKIINQLNKERILIESTSLLKEGGIQINFYYNYFQYKIEITSQSFIFILKYDNRGNLLKEEKIELEDIKNIIKFL